MSDAIPDTVLDEQMKLASRQLVEQFEKHNAHFALLVFPLEGVQEGQMLTCTSLPYEYLIPLIREYIERPTAENEDGVTLIGTPEYIPTRLN
jgi:hypothetical protein